MIVGGIYGHDGDTIVIVKLSPGTRNNIGGIIVVRNGEACVSEVIRKFSMEHLVKVEKPTAPVYLQATAALLQYMDKVKEIS